jgi:glycosyltransferase involved in cell wall biosynthesis
MKVVLVQNQFPDDTHWGGISTFGWFMSKALAKEGVEVHVVCQSSTEELEKPKLIAERITVHRIPCKKPIQGRLIKMITALLPDKQRWFAYNAWLYVKQHLDILYPDIIDCADYLGCGYYFLKDKQFHTPIVVTCHTPSFLADEMNDQIRLKLAMRVVKFTLWKKNRFD